MTEQALVSYDTPITIISVLFIPISVSYAFLAMREIIANASIFVRISPRTDCKSMKKLENETILKGKCENFLETILIIFVVLESKFVCRNPTFSEP